MNEFDRLLSFCISLRKIAEEQFKGICFQKNLDYPGYWDAIKAKSKKLKKKLKTKKIAFDDPYDQETSLKIIPEDPDAISMSSSNIQQQHRIEDDEVGTPRQYGDENVYPKVDIKYYEDEPEIGKKNERTHEKNS